jgi:hypothetical protein
MWSFVTVTCEMNCDVVCHYVIYLSIVKYFLVMSFEYR